MKQFQSTHKLDFLVAPYPLSMQLLEPGEPVWQQFKVGTCNGLWRAFNGNYEILTIKNSSPGNGHFEDVLEWFESSCKRDNYNLVIIELWNEEFKYHLIEKRGFQEYKKPDNSLIKYYAK